MWFVTSTKAHANILSIDPSAALAVPGVVDYVDYRDVPGSNMYGPMVHDIPLFAEKEVRNTFISLLMLNILYSKHNQTCFTYWQLNISNVFCSLIDKCLTLSYNLVKYESHAHCHYNKQLLTYNQPLWLQETDQ